MNTASKGAEPILQVENLSVDFRTDDGIVHAVRDMSFDLKPQEVLGIVGESGSGKSVSSMAIMGLLPRSTTVTGSIRFQGDELVGMSLRPFNEIRGKKIAMIFQDPMTSLNPVHRIGAQISEIILAHNDINKKEAWARAVDMLDRVGIPNATARAKNYPHEFSGGMRQRAMIAMSLANDPEIVIADEPTTALDVTVQAQILELLVKLKDEFHTAILLITHDLGVVAGMADRLLVMYAGRPVEIGRTDAIFAEPHMPYTLGLLGALPRLDADGSERLVPIKGAPPSLVNLPPGCPFQPRCPMATDLCNEVEPVMQAAGLDGQHLASCHYSNQLIGDVRPEEIFDTASEDAALAWAEVEES